MKGQFRIWMPRPKSLILPGEPDFVIPNRVTNEGEQEYLKMIFRDVTEVAGGDDFYIGLCNQAASEEAVLADIDTEPTNAGGYARQPVERSLAGWPTLTEVNGHTVIRTATLTFAASGAAFSDAFSRMFLASVASGAGKLYAFSGALPAAVSVPDGSSFQAQYEVYLD